MSKTDLLLPNCRNWDLVPIASIQYIASERKLCKVVTANRAYTISTSLQAMEPHLPKLQFMRIHKSYIVCLSYVNAIGKRELIIAGKSLPVSRAMVPELYKMFPKFS
jgi:DNA-binding LytR/AlgR family response regulator